MTKLISVKRANRMLPLIRSIATSIEAAWGQIIKKRVELETLEEVKKSGAISRETLRVKVEILKEELNVLVNQINGYIREVEDLGCYVEEFRHGIINFPSLANGRKIFLCWKPGDSFVSHWHELGDTYNERLPIQHSPKKGPGLIFLMEETV